MAIVLGGAVQIFVDIGANRLPLDVYFLGEHTGLYALFVLVAGRLVAESVEIPICKLTRGVVVLSVQGH